MKKKQQHVFYTVNVYYGDLHCVKVDYDFQDLKSAKSEAEEWSKQSGVTKVVVLKHSVSVADVMAVADYD